MRKRILRTTFFNAIIRNFEKSKKSLEIYKLSQK